MHIQVRFGLLDINRRFTDLDGKNFARIIDGVNPFTMQKFNAIDMDGKTY